MVPIVNLDTVGLGFLLPSLTLSRRSFLGFACLGSLFIHDSGDNLFLPSLIPSFLLDFLFDLFILSFSFGTDASRQYGEVRSWRSNWMGRRAVANVKRRTSIRSTLSMPAPILCLAHELGVWGIQAKSLRVLAARAH